MHGPYTGNRTLRATRRDWPRLFALVLAGVWSAPIAVVAQTPEPLIVPGGAEVPVGPQLASTVAGADPAPLDQEISVDGEAIEIDTETVDGSAPASWSVALTADGARTSVVAEDRATFTIVCVRDGLPTNEIRLSAPRVGGDQRRRDGVETETLVLVEGGSDGLATFNVALRYDAAADDWRATMLARGSMAPAIAAGVSVSFAMDGWEIASFPLTGSAAAYNALLDACVK